MEALRAAVLVQHETDVFVKEDIKTEAFSSFCVVLRVLIEEIEDSI